MNNRSFFIAIFSLFFFNTTTECMFTRKTSQLLLASRNCTTSKTLIRTLTQHDSAPLSKEEREKQVTAAIAAHVAEKIKIDEANKKASKDIKACTDVMITCGAIQTASTVVDAIISITLE